MKHVRNFSETRTWFSKNMYMFSLNLTTIHTTLIINQLQIHFKQMLYCIFCQRKITL